jgi:hypothetical protein
MEDDYIHYHNLSKDDLQYLGLCKTSLSLWIPLSLRLPMFLMDASWPLIEMCHPYGAIMMLSNKAVCTRRMYIAQTILLVHTTFFWITSILVHIVIIN